MLILLKQCLVEIPLAILKEKKKSMYFMLNGGERGA